MTEEEAIALPHCPACGHSPKEPDTAVCSLCDAGQDGLTGWSDCRGEEECFEYWLANTRAFLSREKVGDMGVELLDAMTPIANIWRPLPGAARVTVEQLNAFYDAYEKLKAALTPPVTTP